MYACAVGHYLAATAGRHGRYQDRAAAGLVSVERHRDAVDQHLGVALGDLAFAVAGDRTSTAITLAGDGHAHDFAFRRRRADFAAVAGGVVQTYHAAHGESPVEVMERWALFGITLHAPLGVVADAPPHQIGVVLTTRAEPGFVRVDRADGGRRHHQHGRGAGRVSGAGHQHVLGDMGAGTARTNVGL